MAMKRIVCSLTLVWCGALIVAETTGLARAQPGAQVNLFPVQKDGKFGYIDRTGRVIIAPQFDGAQTFSDGLALVQRGCHPAYIDSTGKVVIELACEFNIARPFSEGLAIVGKRGPGDFIQETLGFIDKTGKLVIPLQFDEAGPLTEGLARVSVNHLRGYINSTGTFVIKPQYGEAADFSEGLARVGRRLTMR